VNFLAHFHLAWPDELLLVGGLQGDYHKCPLRGDLPAGIEAGITLHRAIDAFTDGHPQVAELRRQFPPGLRRYAGILIDLCFDHMLTGHWEHFSNIPLHEFNARVYQVLEQEQQHLSADARHMATRMRDYDILGCYHRWDAITGSAARIGERFTRGNPLLDTDAALKPLLPRLEQAFLQFYPDLVAFANGEPAHEKAGTPV